MYKDVIGVALVVMLVVGFGLMYREANPLAQAWLRPRMKRLVIGAIMFAVSGALLIMLAGCASDPAKPRTEAEMFPYRNQDPRVGLVVNTGTAPSNLYIYDAANRLVEQVYLSGAERHIVSPNGQPYPQLWPRRLEPGCYRIDAFPFYHTVLWVPPRMVRIDLPKQAHFVCVGNNPTSQYFGGQHWGWLVLTGTNIPEGGTGLPLIQIVNPFGHYFTR